MGILFGFSNMLLAVIFCRKSPGKGHGYLLFFKSNSRNRQPFFIICHGHEKKVLNFGSPVKSFNNVSRGCFDFSKLVQNEGLGDLSCPVRPKVKKNNSVVFGNWAERSGVLVDNNRGPDKFIGYFLDI